MRRDRQHQDEGIAPRPTTMLDLVLELSALEPRYERVILKAQYLIRTNRVRLTGTFCDRSQKALKLA